MTNLNNIRMLCKLLRNINISNPKIFNTLSDKRTLYTTTVKYDLMEFFDDKKNWGADEVKSGRSWKKELRLKSNSDLHKLWYVLLKERNMLLTMEQEAKDKVRLFPSPERIDKIEDSMENLESVVRERNVAYHELETGETGETPGKVDTSPRGSQQICFTVAPLQCIYFGYTVREYWSRDQFNRLSSCHYIKMFIFD